MSFNFAIMGAGNIAGKFVDAVRRVNGCDVVAVASKSMERAENFARQFEITKYYDSYEIMLQENRIDCVYIATTPNFHYELTKLCLAYNIPVLCEKAMFMNYKEAESVFSESKRKGIPPCSLGPHPLTSLYDPLQAHPFLSHQGRYSNRHLLSLLHHQLFPLQGSRSIIIQNALISPILKKSSFPGSPHSSLAPYHTDFLLPLPPP